MLCKIQYTSSQLTKVSVNWTNFNAHHCCLMSVCKCNLFWLFLQHHRALKFSKCYLYLDQHSSEMLKDSFHLHLLHHSSEINPRELNQGTLFWTNLMTGNFWEEWMFVQKHFSKVSILFCVSLNYKHQVVTPQNSCHWWICPKPNSWDLNPNLHCPEPKSWVLNPISSVQSQNPEYWTQI